MGVSWTYYGNQVTMSADQTITLHALNLQLFVYASYFSMNCKKNK